jgi:glycosyltransferase involved in cell wall biosynthesis
MPTISVIIIAKNEATLIANCLESVKWADEIIVLDSGSTDNTVEIAKKYTPFVYITDWQGYGIQKQRALEKASGDWVLNIDADEEVTESLKNKLLEVVNSSVDACRIPINLMFYQKMMKYSWSPFRHIRFFKREGASYEDKIIHESVKLPKGSQVIQLKEILKHYSFPDVHHALYKINKYSSYTAKIRCQQGKSSSMPKAIFGSLWMFFRCYIVQWGFLDGKSGFLLAVLNSQGSFYRAIKQIYREESLNDLPTLK